MLKHDDNLPPQPQPREEREALDPAAPLPPGDTPSDIVSQLRALQEWAYQARERETPAEVPAPDAPAPLAAAPPSWDRAARPAPDRRMEQPLDLHLQHDDPQPSAQPPARLAAAPSRRRFAITRRRGQPPAPAAPRPLATTAAPVGAASRQANATDKAPAPPRARPAGGREARSGSAAAKPALPGSPGSATAPPRASDHQPRAPQARKRRGAAAAAAVTIPLLLALLAGLWMHSHPVRPAARGGAPAAATPATPVERTAGSDLAARQGSNASRSPGPGAQEPARPWQAPSTTPPPKAAPAPIQAPGPAETARGTKLARQSPSPATVPLASRPAEPSLILEPPQDSASPPPPLAESAAGAPAGSPGGAPAGSPEAQPAARPPAWLRPRAADPGQRHVEPPPADAESPPPAPPAGRPVPGSGSAAAAPIAPDALTAAGATPASGEPAIRGEGEAAPPPARPAPPAFAPPVAAGRAADLSGSWEVHNVVHSTSDPSYRGLRLTYRIKLRNEGGRIVGDGEKLAENDRRIPVTQRTPIHLTGEVVGRELRVQFTEDGSQRESAGSFRWRLSPDGRSLAGTFTSDVAASQGISAAYRLP